MKILFAVLFLTGCMHGGSLYTPDVWLYKQLEAHVASNPNYKRFPSDTPHTVTNISGMSFTQSKGRYGE